MNNPNRKRRILRSLDLAEVSAVDRPAQAPAQAILMKNMNTEDIVKEAVGVHVDGQEPHYKAEEYEAALLAIARTEQKPSENVADAMARVASNGNPDVSALLFAADRVRARDAASVGKAAPAPSPVAEDAQRVAKSGTSPRYTRDDYHDEMLSISKNLARPGESVAAAFSRLAGDGLFDALYAAGEQADIAEERAALSKGVSRDERFDRLLLDMAKMRRAPGETIEAAASRLLEHDPVIRDAYAAVHGA